MYSISHFTLTFNLIEGFVIDCYQYQISLFCPFVNLKENNFCAFISSHNNKMLVLYIWIILLFQQLNFIFMNADLQV